MIRSLLLSAALCLAALLMAVGACSQCPARNQDSIGAPSSGQAVSKKRSAPERVEPIAKHGVRYEPVRGGKGRGLEQNGGYIRAVDEKTLGELWILKVYDVAYDSGMEADKQDVFITRLSFGPGPDQILVENEKGGRYIVDLKTRSVTGSLK